MIMTQGELVRSRNVYYHYAMVEPVSNEAQKNVIGAMGSLSGCGGSYRGYGGSDSGFVYFLAVPDSTAVTSAPRFAAAIAQINANPGLSDSDKAAIAVKAVCDQLSYQINGGASWSNGLEKGDCESYALMLNQILAAAGLPNINMAGQTSAGGHAWVQANWMASGLLSMERWLKPALTTAESCLLLSTKALLGIVDSTTLMA